jgi:hypothetical protein
VAVKLLTGADLGNQRLINLADASSATDGVNLQTLQAYVRGLTWKPAVRAASTTNGALASAFENGDLLDGITLVTDDLILLKDQSTGAENGIYRVNATGAPTRIPEMATGSDGRGAATTVVNGTVNNDRTYVQTADPAAVGTNALVFTQLGGGGSSYTAGSGLTESPAGTFNVETGTASATGLEINSDTVRIAAAAAGNGLTGGGGSALAVNTGSGLEVSSDAVRIAAGAAGTGLTGGGGSALAVDTSVVARKFSQDIGNASSTSIAVTHSLGTKDVIVQLRQTADDAHVMADVVSTSTSVVTIGFASAPGTGAIRCTVIG